jgi:hypothetical protein
MKRNIIVYSVSIILAFVLGAFFAWGSSGRGNRFDFGGHFGPCGRFGAGPGYGHQFGLMPGNFMRSELNLTDQQVKQIFDLGTEFRAKCFENRNNPDKLTSLQAEHRKAIEKILTKDQLDKFNDRNDGNGRYGCFGGRMFRRF